VLESCGSRTDRVKFLAEECSSDQVDPIRDSQLLDMVVQDIG
jgi:hypothetical protein